jgi:hypothetical protein
MALLLVLGAAPMSASGEHGEVVPWGRFGILNNQWGAALGHADAESYQRVSIDEGRVVFAFDWRNKTADDRTWVKAFPAIVAGWHYGVPVYPGEPTLGRLPVQVSKKPALTTVLRVRRVGGAASDVMNLAWDIWLTASKPDPNATEPMTPAAEVMVWPWRQQQGPLTLEGSSSKTCARTTVDGPIVASPMLWSRAWDVSFGCGSNGSESWPVISFVPHDTLMTADGAIAASGRLGDFLTYLSLTAPRWTTWNETWWVAGVEFGSEIIQGRGAWMFDQYRIEP